MEWKIWKRQSPSIQMTWRGHVLMRFTGCGQHKQLNFFWNRQTRTTCMRSSISSNLVIVQPKSDFNTHREAISRTMMIVLPYYAFDARKLPFWMHHWKAAPKVVAPFPIPPPPINVTCDKRFFLETHFLFKLTSFMYRHPMLRRFANFTTWNLMIDDMCTGST